MRILITGGAGFVGSSLAQLFKEHGAAEVCVLDNLKRRGSELNLPHFQKKGIRFFHGDIRNPNDFEALEGNFDLFIEASAEPSVHAGVNSSPNYLLETNLGGTIPCLNFSRTRVGKLIFLSTSRVYSIQPLKELPLEEKGDRLVLSNAKGIAENFATHLPRSLYGASKLASELLVQEYAATYGVKAIINRCGVIAGPGQFGKVDQGVFTLWIARHFFGGKLSYTGFGGKGKQVRDLLHPRDLFTLMQKQIANDSAWTGDIFNIGGGEKISTSLAEWTQEARAATGKEIPIESNPNTASVDIPWYISDTTKAEKTFQWTPKVSRKEIAQEITAWMKNNESMLAPLFKS